MRNIVKTNNTGAVFKIVSNTESVTNSTEFDAAQDVANTVNLFDSVSIPYQIIVKAEAGNIKSYVLQ